MSSVQYVVIVIPFSVGKPFRKPISSNIALCLNIVLILMLNYYVILYPHPAVIKLMKFYYGDWVSPEKDMRLHGMMLIITLLTLLYSIVAYAYEKVIVANISRISGEIKGDD